MSRTWVMWRREMAGYLLSPVAYVAAAVFLAAVSGTFLVEVFRNVGSSAPVQTFLFDTIVVWLTLLLTVMTMRLFSEEKRSGTIETLLTAPVSEYEVVMGKYAATYAFVIASLAPAMATLWILRRMAPALGPLDWGALAGGSLFLLLFAALGTALGELISLLTRSPIIAAICCFCALWGLLLGGWVLTVFPFGLDRAADYLSLSAHLEAMARGVVDVRPVALCLSVTGFLLFCCVRVLESRQWK